MSLDPKYWETPITDKHSELGRNAFQGGMLLRNGTKMILHLEQNAEEY